MRKYNLGGLIDDLVPVELEGEEVFELPTGGVTKVKGPKHEQGGVELDLPIDTMVYSDAIKGPDGKSMAERKLIRTKALEQAIGDDPFNAIARNTLERVKMWAEKEEMADELVMELTNELGQVMRWGGKVKKMEKGGKVKKYTTGGPVLGDILSQLLKQRASESQVVNPIPSGLGNSRQEQPLPKLPSILETDAPIGGSSPRTPLLDQLLGIFDSQVGPGGTNPIEALGSAALAAGPIGAAVGTFAPLLTTLLTGPGGNNQNPYQGYGNEALASLDEAERGLDGSRDLAIAENTLATEDQLSGIRSNTSSAGVARSASQGAIANRIRGNNKVTTQFSDRLSRLLTQRSRTELNIDDKVMSGADTAEVRDTQDRDNFFTSLNSDLRNVGTGLMFQDRQTEEVDILKLLGL